MADLKAAAKELREIVDGAWSGRESQDACILAAQALEAWVWQQEKLAKVIPWGMEWRCSDGEEIRVNADTPLGAVLEAMEGEKDEGR